MTIQKALETTSLKRELSRYRRAQEERFGLGNLVGRNPKISEVFELVRKIAASSATTILLQGESGTGKDLLANAIHYASDRAKKPFMNITCSALPETLLETELFGHEKGAFTDAKASKKGLFELADGGHRLPRRGGRDRPEPPVASSCGSSRTGPSSAWAARWTSRWTCASSPPPT